MKQECILSCLRYEIKLISSTFLENLVGMTNEIPIESERERERKRSKIHPLFGRHYFNIGM